MSMLFSGGKVKIYDQQLNSHCHFYTDFIGSICRYTMSKLLTCWIQVKEIFIWERILRLVSMLKIWRKSLSRIWKTLKRSSRRYNFNCIIDFGQQDSRLFSLLYGIYKCVLLDNIVDTCQRICMVCQTGGLEQQA